MLSLVWVGILFVKFAQGNSVLFLRIAAPIVLALNNNDFLA